MRAAPERVRQPSPEAVRDRDGEQQLGRHDSERRPHGSIGSRAGDEQISESEAQVVVQEKDEDVQPDEDAGEHPRKAVNVLDCEARPASQPWPAGEGEAEHGARRQKREAEDPAGAGDIPGDVHAAAE